MTIVAIVLGVGLLALLAVVLGVMREAVILRGEVQALASLITTPPAPSFMGSVLPNSLIRRIAETAPREASANGSDAPTSHVLAFLTSDCTGCAALVSEIDFAISAGTLDPEFVKQNITAVVASRDDGAAASPVATAARSVLDAVIIDNHAELTRAADIRQAPTLIEVRMPDAVVVDYQVAGGLEWILKVLRPSQTAPSLN